MPSVRRLIRIWRSIWIWATSAGLIASWTVVVAVVRVFDRDPLHLRTARSFRMLGRLLAKVNPWRLQITGLEHRDPARVYVIVCNHQSLADIPLLAHLPVDAKWLGKAELFRLPVIGWMMRMAGDIPVERGNPRKAAQALLQCGRYLDRHCSMVFFPEGTRSRDGELLPFNEGPFQLALRERVPVLPVVLDGSGAALPRDTWLFEGMQNIHLRVLEPVAVEGRNPRASGSLRDEVRQRMVDELHRMQAEAGDGCSTATPSS